MTDVNILAGSESDRELVRQVEDVLKRFRVSFKSYVASAHRTPGKVEEIVKKSDAKLFIAVAGLSAALPGVIASHTVKPVIGVPKNVKLGGLDSLLSMVQMPPGVPVATVGIDNAKNAALLAIEILAVDNEELQNKLARETRENR